MVFDCRGFKWETISRTYVYNVFTHLQSAITFRIECILFVSPPPNFEGVWGLLSGVLSASLRSKCRVVTAEELTEYIPEEKLIKDMGGSFKYNPKTFIEQRMQAEPVQESKDALKSKSKDGVDSLPSANNFYTVGKAQKRLANFLNSNYYDKGLGLTEEEPKDSK